MILRPIRWLRSRFQVSAFPWRFQPLQFDMKLGAGGETPIRVREATAADVEEWTRSWKPEMDGDAPEAAWERQEHVSRAAIDPDFLCLAAVDENGLQGLTSLRVGRGESELRVPEGGVDSKDQSLGFYRTIAWLEELGPHTLPDGTWVYFEGEFGP